MLHSLIISKFDKLLNSASAQDMDSYTIWMMLSSVLFASECPELQTGCLLSLMYEDMMKRINNGLMIMMFRRVDSRTLFRCR